MADKIKPLTDNAFKACKKVLNPKTTKILDIEVNDAADVVSVSEKTLGITRAANKSFYFHDHIAGFRSGFVAAPLNLIDGALTVYTGGKVIHKARKGKIYASEAALGSCDIITGAAVSGASVSWFISEVGEVIQKTIPVVGPLVDYGFLAASIVSLVVSSVRLVQLCQFKGELDELGKKLSVVTDIKTGKAQVDYTNANNQKFIREFFIQKLMIGKNKSDEVKVYSRRLDRLSKMAGKDCTKLLSEWMCWQKEIVTCFEQEFPNKIQDYPLQGDLADKADFIASHTGQLINVSEKLSNLAGMKKTKFKDVEKNLLEKAKKANKLEIRDQWIKLVANILLVVISLVLIVTAATVGSPLWIALTALGLAIGLFVLVYNIATGKYSFVTDKIKKAAKAIANAVISDMASLLEFSLSKTAPGPQMMNSDEEEDKSKDVVSKRLHVGEPMVLKEKGSDVEDTTGATEYVSLSNSLDFDNE